MRRPADAQVPCHHGPVRARDPSRPAEVSLSRLDPRAPLVVDTRDLGRRPGSMRTIHRTVPAPPALGIAVIGVPVGSDVELDLRLESVVEGVLITADAGVRLRGECVRCLEPVSEELHVPVQELFYYPDQHPEDAEASRLVGDLLDLEPALRDAIVLGLPFGPVCRADCPGLCAECGARLADEPGHRHVQFDSRWDALHALQAQAIDSGLPSAPQAPQAPQTPQASETQVWRASQAPPATPAPQRPASDRQVQPAGENHR